MDIRVCRCLVVLHPHLSVCCLQQKFPDTKSILAASGEDVFHLMVQYIQTIPSARFLLLSTECSCCGLDTDPLSSLPLLKVVSSRLHSLDWSVVHWSV